MKRVLLGLIFIVSFLSSTPSFGYFTFSELFDGVDEKKIELESLQGGYLLGLIDAYIILNNTIESMDGENVIMFCLPDEKNKTTGITQQSYPNVGKLVAKMRDIRAELKTSEESKSFEILIEHTPQLMMWSLISTYPCKKNLNN